MTFESNVSELNSYVSRAPEANRSIIKDVIKLYEDKKIVNFRAALNATLLLSSTNKNTIKSGRAEKEYNKIVDKYSEAYPMTGRLNGPLFKVISGDYNRAKTHVKINIQYGEDQDRTLSTCLQPYSLRSRKSFKE